MGQSSLNHSSNIKKQIDLVERLCELEEYSQAESYLKTLIEKDPKNTRILSLFSFIAAQQKEYERAIDFIKQAIAIDPEEVSFYSNLGNLYTNIKKFEDALNCYRKAILIQPDNHNLYKKIGFVYGIKGDMAAANFNYGLAQQKQGNTIEAIRFYRKVTQEQSDCVEAYFNLGTLYQQQAEIERAIECYQKATALKSDCVEAYYKLGSLFHQKGALSPAIYNYEQVIKHQPNSGEAHLNLSVLYKKQGNLDLAFKACQNALQYQAQTANSFYTLKNASATKRKQQNRTEQSKKAITDEKKIPPITEISQATTHFKESSKIESQEKDIVTEKLIEKTDSTKIIPEKINANKSNYKTSKTSRIDDIALADYQYNSIYKERSALHYIEKELIADRVLDNQYSFIVTTFFPQAHLKTAFIFLEYLAKTDFSYCLYQTPQIHQSSALSGEIRDTSYTKPNYFASVYDSLMGKTFSYSRTSDFTHILYLDYRLLFSLDKTTINSLQENCDRNVDFATYNYLQNMAESEKLKLQIEPDFLFSSDSIQLYRLSDNSLSVWQYWQQAIQQYAVTSRDLESYVFPESRTFLDYVWNSKLRHDKTIKYSWLDSSYFRDRLMPFSQNLIT